jgi:hypothetical protein
VKTNEYDDLKGKNFWRIIGQNNLQNYLTSKNANLSRIFSGTEITNLKAVEMVG